MDTGRFNFTYTGHTQGTPHIQSSIARYINRDEIKAFFWMKLDSRISVLYKICGKISKNFFYVVSDPQYKKILSLFIPAYINS